jgi:large subunit ribosomal protein L25
MSSVIQINGTRREKLGKGGARKARAAGQIPGVLYGHGETPVPIAVVAREFQTALRSHKGGNALVNLKLEAGEYTALVRDAQYDPLSRAILHLDFQHISLTEQVIVEVELRPAGLALGVKDGGGILEMIIRTVEVRCLPTAIPESIQIDVTSLVVGASLHVRDIQVEGVEILTDADATVATVVPPTVEEVVATPEGVAAAGTPEPEVVGAKGKKDEEGAEEKPEKAEKGEKGKEKDKK